MIASYSFSLDSAFFSLSQRCRRCMMKVKGEMSHHSTRRWMGEEKWKNTGRERGKKKKKEK